MRGIGGQATTQTSKLRPEKDCTRVCQTQYRLCGVDPSLHSGHHFQHPPSPSALATLRLPEGLCKTKSSKGVLAASIGFHVSLATLVSRTCRTLEAPPATGSGRTSAGFKSDGASRRKHARGTTKQMLHLASWQLPRNNFGPNMFHPWLGKNGLSRRIKRVCHNLHPSPQGESATSPDPVAPPAAGRRSAGFTSDGARNMADDSAPAITRAPGPKQQETCHTPFRGSVPSPPTPPSPCCGEKK